MNIRVDVFVFGGPTEGKSKSINIRENEASIRPGTSGKLTNLVTVPGGNKTRLALSPTWHVSPGYWKEREQPGVGPEMVEKTAAQIRKCRRHGFDMGSVCWSGRSPGGGHGNPLQYSCLENPHGQRSLIGDGPGVTKSQTQLK